MTTTDPAPQPTLTTASGESWKRGFWSLFLTQFQGAFNDNAFKFLVTFLVLSLGFTTDERDQLAPVVGALFALPFILFSMSGGYLSDRNSKRSVAIGTKVAELLIMATAVVGLALNSIPLLIVVVFLLSTQSAFFGPAKYGLRPSSSQESGSPGGTEPLASARSWPSSRAPSLRASCPSSSAAGKCGPG